MAGPERNHVPILTRQIRPDVSMALSETGEAVITAVSAAASGTATGILAWPGGFAEAGAALAVGAMQAQARGDESFRSLIFPWRNTGPVNTMSSLMVDERLMVETARARATSRAARAEPRSADIAGREAYDLLTMRMKSLYEGGGEAKGRRARTLTAELRHPTLAELFPVFAPTGPGANRISPIGKGFLSRIRGYTDVLSMVDTNGFDHYASMVEKPENSPFSMFGIPAGPAIERKRTLDQVGGEAPRVVYIDLSLTARKALGGPSRWQETTFRFVDDVKARWPGIGIVAVTDNPKVFEAFCKGTKDVPALVKVKNFVLSGGKAMTTRADLAGRRRGSVQWTVSPKDASITSGVWQSFDMMRDLYKWGHGSAAVAAHGLQEKLLKLTAYPCGWGDVKVFIASRNGGVVPEILADRYTPTTLLQRVSEAALAERYAGETARETQIRAYVNHMSGLFLKLQHATPVSGALRRLESLTRMPADVKIGVIFDNQDMVDYYREVFIPSIPEETRAKLAARTIPMSQSEFRAAMDSGEAARWLMAVVVQPEQEDLGMILASPTPPPRVSILCDAYTARNRAGHLNVTSSIMRGTEWADELSGLREKLIEGVDELPDLIASFEMEKPEANVYATPIPVIAGSGDRIVIVSEGGDAFACGARTAVLISTSDVLTPYRRALAGDMEEGDEFLVPSEDIPSRIIAALRRLDRNEAEQRQGLARYHSEILKGVSSIPWSNESVARKILERMRKFLPDLKDGEVVNITRWIDVKPGQETPQSVADKPRFMAFALSVGLSPKAAEKYFTSTILPWRALRKENGLDLYHRAIDFLCDPDSAAMHLALSPQALDEIIVQTSAAMRTVREIRRAPGMDQELDREGYPNLDVDDLHAAP